MSSERPCADDYVIASHPIFTRDMGVLAHELLFRRCTNDECAAIACCDDATNAMIADGFALATGRLGKESLLSVNVGIDNILSRSVRALPPERVLLEVPGNVPAGEKFLGVCAELRAAGYRFVVDGYDPGANGAAALAALASYVKIPVAGADGKAVARVRQSLAGHGCGLIASRVESWEAFEGCKFLGFDYFQGFFFAYPREIVGKKLSSHKLSQLRLQRLLVDKDADMAHIVDVISMDQALTIRLLHFVNSAAFSMGSRVDSLARAAALIGLKTLRKWAMTAILADADASERGQELSYRTLHSAVFLSLLGDRLPPGGPDADTLYLLGLLHNVDAVMGLKMQDIIDEMPLMAVVRKALMRDGDEPLARFILLVDAIWRNDWATAQGYLQTLGVPLPVAAKAYMQAGVVTEQMQAALAS